MRRGTSPDRYPDTARRGGTALAVALALKLALTLAATTAGGATASNGADTSRQRWVEPRAGDTFVALARRHGVPFDALVAANPDTDPFAPSGDPVVLPLRPLPPSGPAEGIVVNLPELRLYHHDGEGGVAVYPIGVGRVGDETPLADTRVTRVEADPAWRPPASIRAEYAAAGLALPAVVPPGPDNPLGRHAVRLALPGYLLHGTNAPEGVGMRVSHGCIRLYPEDIARLFETVSPGTRVRIVDEPLKWAFEGAHVLVEAHRPLAVEGRDGGALLRERVDALRAEIAARGASLAAFDDALGRLHDEGRLFDGLVHALPLETRR